MSRVSRLFESRINSLRDCNESWGGALPRGVPDTNTTRQALQMPAEIKLVGNNVEFLFRNKDAVDIFKMVMNKNRVIPSKIAGKKVVISKGALMKEYSPGSTGTRYRPGYDESINESYEYKISWDDQDPNYEGWYVEVRKDGKYHDDSEKVSFELDVDDYGPRDEKKLLRDLKRAYE